LAVQDRRKVSAHPIRDLLSFYDMQYQKHLGDRAPINGAKDSAIIKKLMDTYPEDKIRLYLAAFFECPDPFIQQSGYTIGVFRACLGKIIQFANKRGPVKSPLSEAVADPMRAWLEQKKASGL
jgi:hypothetical protein